jgi:Cu2+-containing amine oxidase
MRTKNKHMKTITKFIFGFPMLALACGSVAFAQVPIPPVTPADSAAKAAALGPPPAGAVDQMVAFESGSRWHLTVNAVERFGLVITGASFQKSPTSPFLYVLFDGRLGEIFVPYHDGQNRFHDISDPDFDFEPIRLPQAKFPPPRQIIGGGKICKERRDYLAWMTASGQVGDDKSTRVRYGQEVVYFSVLKAGNYDYIMEWTFRDDGAILVRAGSTGPKIDAGEATTLGHMHDFTWRLDIDLNGANNNLAYLTGHFENLELPSSESTATDKMALISVEGSRFWRPENFNTLGIANRNLENGHGRTTTYELVPMRSGTARHSEPYTKADFWVTRYNPEEIFANNLPTYVRDRQPTEDQDLVIWYTGSEHHENDSRDEDLNTVPVLWTGFELIPNNLFDNTPFYPQPSPSPTP